MRISVLAAWWILILWQDMVRENSLLTTAAILWNEAVKSSELLSLESPQKCQRDLERALKCLFAGLELVLPTVLEVKFRLKAASLLQKYTHNTVEACEQLRKALHLLQTVKLLNITQHVIALLEK